MRDRTVRLCHEHTGEENGFSSNRDRRRIGTIEFEMMADGWWSGGPRAA
jgi:hypothetical protein